MFPGELLGTYAGDVWATGTGIHSPGGIGHEETFFRSCGLSIGDAVIVALISAVLQLQGVSANIPLGHTAKALVKMRIVELDVTV